MENRPESGLSFLRLPEVISRCGLKRSTIYRRVKSGDFPEPIRLGTRATVWAENEIDAWIRERIAERDQQAVPS